MPQIRRAVASSNGPPWTLWKVPLPDTLILSTVSVSAPNSPRLARCALPQAARAAASSRSAAI